MYDPEAIFGFARFMNNRDFPGLSPNIPETSQCILTGVNPENGSRQHFVAEPDGSLTPIQPANSIRYTAKEEHRMGMHTTVKAGWGHTDKRLKPSHTKLVECNSCWAKVWIHPDSKTAICASCLESIYDVPDAEGIGWRAAEGGLWTPNSSSSSSSRYNRGYTSTKPTSAKPKRTAKEMREEHWVMLQNRLASQ